MWAESEGCSQPWEGAVQTRQAGCGWGAVAPYTTEGVERNKTTEYHEGRKLPPNIAVGGGEEPSWFLERERARSVQLLL